MIVIPLWTITLVDYFLVKREQYTDDLFRERGGLYWYRNGWNWPAVASLLLIALVLITVGSNRLIERRCGTENIELEG